MAAGVTNSQEMLTANKTPSGEDKEDRDASLLKLRRPLDYMFYESTKSKTY